MNEMKELNPEELEKASGGYVVDNGTGNLYWVVRDDGTVIGPAPTLDNAVDFAKAFNVSTKILTLSGYKKEFGHDLQW